MKKFILFLLLGVALLAILVNFIMGIPFALVLVCAAIVVSRIDNASPVSSEEDEEEEEEEKEDNV